MNAKAFLGDGGLLQKTNCPSRVTVRFAAVTMDRRAAGPLPRRQHAVEDQIMPGDYFWSCVEALSIALEGDALTADTNLGIYVHHCTTLQPDTR